MKRFVIGFAVGVGLMYLFLNHGDNVQTEINRWFQGSAANYRADKQHQAAREALGESGPRR